MREQWAKWIACLTLVLLLGSALLFAWHQDRQRQALENNPDPMAWSALFPRHVASYLRTAEDTGRTAYGGSTPYDKLAANPFRRRAWAGYPFALEYNAARGHFHAQADQQRSRRTLERDQPAGCIYCHAAETPQLLENLGWEALNSLRYDELRDQLAHGSSCGDCHDASTMALRISRPALRHALLSQGQDPDALSQQDLRSYVCAQCHVEYYFAGDNQTLTLPWANGRRAEDIAAYFDEIGHSDWTHRDTGAELIKIQHPETELYGTSRHAREGVHCADCHMPQYTEDGLRMTDHWIRSPLTQIERACLGCHTEQNAAGMEAHVVAVQDATTESLSRLEDLLSALMDAIITAKDRGADEALLSQARQAQRHAQLRWDFIDAENSTGFHSPREAARILEAGMEIARDGLDALR